jgi:hyperosmotically inducible periplasmic protein
MNTNTKASFIQLLLMGVLLTGIISACGDAKTAADAPNSTNSNGQVSTAENSGATQNDAQSEMRRKQLEADIRAREQRNNMAGDPLKRTEGDLASEVRSKLEANIPLGKLTVAAKNADVTVSGVVRTSEELGKIKPLAMEIKGVSSVTVKAVVTP